MRFLSGLDTPPRIDEEELIDDETQPYSDFRAGMRDVRRANTFLLGTAVVTRQVRRWLREGGVKSPTFLDVATGSADIPQAVARLVEHSGGAARIVGLDCSRPILRYAREEIGEATGISLVRGDAFRLPFADCSVDYVLCSLAFHHFGFERSVQALREMERVARRGWIVNDIRRAWSAWLLLRLILPLARTNRLSRHDGPASVLRAYSVPEYRAMAEALALRSGVDFELRRSLFYRVALIRSKA
jgi:SAM-dependent methyltransferase